MVRVEGLPNSVSFLISSMEYDIPPGVVSSPPRETGAVAMNPAAWSVGVEGRPRRLSRFDTPPHGIEVTA